jgi:hypothetical protein
LTSEHESSGIDTYGRSPSQQFPGITHYLSTFGRPAFDLANSSLPRSSRRICLLEAKGFPSENAFRCTLSTVRPIAEAANAGEAPLSTNAMSRLTSSSVHNVLIGRFMGSAILDYGANLIRQSFIRSDVISVVYAISLLMARHRNRPKVSLSLAT